jgi:tetratricopeptide (TPR) repeat protein
VSKRLGLALFCIVLKGQASPPTCSFQKAVQLQQAQDFPAAIREYEACIAEQPDRPEARSNLGAILARLGRYQEAIAQYQAALKVTPPEIAPRLRFNLALAYYKSFQIPEAAAQLETLHAAQPADLNIAVLLADCRLRMGEFDAAIQVATPLEPAHTDEPALEYVLGMALIRAGKINEGQVRVNRIMGRGESAEGRLLLGVALFTAGNYPEAVKEFAKAEALKPDLPSLHSYYGQALLFTGDADGAAQAFRKELAIDPNDFDANFQLASILWHRGDRDGARPLLERAVQVRPGSREARDALANGFQLAASDAGVPAGSAAPPVAGIDLAHLSRPVALVFGSYTCPKLRTSAGDLKRIAQAYAGQVDFRLVYIREAHSEADWQSTINEREGVSLAPARDLTEKRQHADLCLRKLNLPWPSVVDGMEGAAETAYQAWPSRVYVIGTGGRVAFNSRLGELDFRPAEFEAALREMLGKKGSDVRR